MEKSPKTGERSKPRRAPYRQPKLRAYGSIQSITQARQIIASKFDGAGGGGKTQV
jgi:hypothetical protein